MSARYRLTVHQSDLPARELAADPTRTLLQQLHSAGFDVPHACRNGNCGRCYARLLEGSASHVLNQNTLPLCISHALSDVQLELPTAPQWKHYACQLLNQSDDRLQLQLPAGKAALEGYRFAVLTKHSGSVATVLEQGQRLISFQLQTPFTAASGDIVWLLCASPPGGGRHRLLFREQTVLSECSVTLLREIRESLLQFGLNTQIVP